MSNQTTNIKIYICLAVIALAFTLGTASAENGDQSFWKVGTLLTYEGLEWTGENWAPYDQYVKCSGQVILPETQANMYYLVEMFGRDSETMIMRQTPFGDRLYYYLGNEYVMSLGPVGSTWEANAQGEALRGEIMEDGTTLTLPTGEVYNNLVIMNLYDISCESDPVLLETQWLSRELGFAVKIIQWPPDNPFIEWLVSITRK